MRYYDLLERAATAQGSSKFVGKNGVTFYINHRVDEPSMVHAHAYVAGTTPFEPNRRKIGVASCTMIDRTYDPERNNVRVYSDKSYVDPEFRRYGVLGAMYDHLGKYGFVVYPASGEIGNAALQAQSDDAKAFWAARQRRPEAKLIPVGDAEFWGWNSPFGTADEVVGRPVLEKLKLEGNSYPMLVLWQKQYATGGIQRVGVMYDNERGYRPVLMITDRQLGTMHDFPYVRDDGSIRIYYANMERKLRPGTASAIRAVETMLDKARLAAREST